MAPTTIDVHAIPLLTLPSVPFVDRKRLPRCAAIYFVLNAYGAVLYIGQSINLAVRWAGHHRTATLIEKQATRIAWLLMQDITLLDAVESACIAYFEPICNGRYRHSLRGVHPKQKPGQVPKGYKQTVIQLPPDLLDWAKHQPEGLAGLARLLFAAERKRRECAS